VANRKHLKLLRRSVDDWNQWRQDNADVRPDLSEAKLSGANLVGADLRLANLRQADLTADLTEANLYMAELRKAKLSGARLRHTILVWANLTQADLSSADLHRADLQRADLQKANLRGAGLSEANLDRADLSEADLTGADLTWAALIGANLVGAKVERATFLETYVYGIAAWDLKGTPRSQRDLVISRQNDEPVITVDDIEIAQFIYLLLRNEKIRDVIDTITSKVVLILGRFTPSRKAVLDRLRDELRNHNLVPMMFDFTKPASKDVTGTVETLARMARFIIADLTDPSSIPHELATIVPYLRTTPVVPLRLAGTTGYSMFDDFGAYPWVLPIHEYQSLEQLTQGIEAIVITPAEEKRRLLT
jgi:hypothetical protein